MKFDWDEFRNIENKIAVHCKTEEEANDFCRNMHNNGFEWSNGESYLDVTNYKVCRGDTCYSSDGFYCNYECYFSEGRKILEWSDYMETENDRFTKADLKDGMFVVQRNGKIKIKIGDFLIGYDRHGHLGNYNDDLEHFNMNLSGSNIVKIGMLRSSLALEDVKEEDLDIIWERKEPQKLTLEDAAKKLKELTGEDYEIV